MRNFISPPQTAWIFHGAVGGNRIYRKYEELKELGEATLHLTGDLVIVFHRRGVKEWDGRRLKVWVEATEVGWRMDYAPPQFVEATELI